MTKQNVQLRILLLAGLTLGAVLLLVPTFVSELPSFWKSYLPTQKLHLGLDLQGGTHLVLTVETDKAIENALDRYADRIANALTEEKITGATAKRDGKQVVVSVPTDSNSQAKGLLDSRFGNLKAQDSSAGNGISTTRLGVGVAEMDDMRELAIEQSLETIRNRIDQFGVSEPIIQREGSEGILVQLPGIQDPQRAKELIGRTALLELKLLPPNANAAEYESGTKPLPEGWELLDGIESNTDPVENRTTRTRRKYVVEKKTLLTGDMIVNAQPRPGQTGLDNPYVEWELNSEGADTFEKVTGANVGRQLAIVLDNTVYSAPVIRDRIGGGRAVIEGDFDLNEARDLAIVLRAGALPAPVTIAEERTVGPSLGQDSINQGVTSFIVGGGLVILFMVAYYRGGGALANVAVLLNILLLLACLALFQATVTLPGIAGIVLTLGMAVDANVLIMERIREEMRVGKTAKTAVEAGYERALPSILDSNVTTFLAGIILFQFGTGPVKGFAVTLCVGILTTVFTAVYATRTIYDYRIANRTLNKVSVGTLEMVKPGTAFDFVRIRYAAMAVSGVVILAGFISLIAHGGPNYGIDFTSGTTLQVRFNSRPDIDEVRGALEPLGMESATIQDFSDAFAAGNEFAEYLIRLPLASNEGEDSSVRVTDALKAKFGAEAFQVLRSETVGPRVGKELRQQATMAVLFATVMMGIYVWFRFDLRFGIGAAVALFHDVAVTIGFLSIFNYEVDLTIVAALLTIVGFSVNDTVIVSDRIRENLHRARKEGIDKIINVSINETLSRTIITTGTALMVVLALYFLGGTVIRGFAFSLLVGFVAGVYSSVYIASPIVLMFEGTSLAKAR